VPDAQNILADMVLQRELRQEQVQLQLNELCGIERLKLLKQDGLLHLPQVVDKKVRSINISCSCVNFIYFNLHYLSIVDYRGTSRDKQRDGRTQSRREQ
jgi:hypothetical protein